jgi:hypothetical protein
VHQAVEDWMLVSLELERHRCIEGLAAICADDGVQKGKYAKEDGGCANSVLASRNRHPVAVEGRRMSIAERPPESGANQSSQQLHASPSIALMSIR